MSCISSFLHLSFVIRLVNVHFQKQRTFLFKNRFSIIFAYTFLCTFLCFRVLLLSTIIMGTSHSKKDSHESIKDVAEVDTTTGGFHLVEIHAPSVGVSYMFLILVLLGFLGLYGCYLKFVRKPRDRLNNENNDNQQQHQQQQQQQQILPFWQSPPPSYPLSHMMGMGGMGGYPFSTAPMGISPGVADFAQLHSPPLNIDMGRQVVHYHPHQRNRNRSIEHQPTVTEVPSSSSSAAVTSTSTSTSNSPAVNSPPLTQDGYNQTPLHMRGE